MVKLRHHAIHTSSMVTSLATDMRARAPSLPGARQDMAKGTVDGQDSSSDNTVLCQKEGGRGGERLSETGIRTHTQPRSNTHVRARCTAMAVDVAAAMVRAKVMHTPLVSGCGTSQPYHCLMMYTWPLGTHTSSSAQSTLRMMPTVTWAELRST